METPDMPDMPDTPAAPRGLPPLRWRGLAPVDWSTLPPLGDTIAEGMRYVKKWAKERHALKLPMRAPPIVNHAHRKDALKRLREMRRTTGLPLLTLPDWRGMNRIAEDVITEYYVLAERQSTKRAVQKSTVARKFRPDTQSRNPWRELERAADFMGRRLARKTPWRIGPKAAPWPGLTPADFDWLRGLYPSERWQRILALDYGRRHLNARAEWAYDVESVRLPPSQRASRPMPVYSHEAYVEWLKQGRSANSPIDSEEADLDFAEQLRLEEAWT